MVAKSWDNSHIRDFEKIQTKASYKLKLERNL